jgi:hypothetical protein
MGGGLPEIESWFYLGFYADWLGSDWFSELWRI